MTTTRGPDQPGPSDSGTTPWAAPPFPSPDPSSSPPTGLPSYPVGGADYGPPPVPGLPPLPPGVVLAPIGRRIGAYFLSILLVIVTLVIGFIIWGLILWGRGTSPAFSVLKMRCVKVKTGERATFGTMALRNIVGGILEGILSWITELISLVLFLSRADRRSLRDLVGGTIVVHDPERRLDSIP